MVAEIISVGTELLLGQTIDTNAAELGRYLATIGIDHYRRQTVGDNLSRLADSLTLALSRADLVVTIGGLGPTEDDLTRDGIALALGEPLVEDALVRRHLIAYFERRGFPWTENQLRQAMRPVSGECVVNPNGSAPALWCAKDGKIVAALPGPPNEFVPFVEGLIGQRLAGLKGDPLFSRVLRVVGIGEGQAEDMLRDLLDSPRFTLAPYAKTGEVHFRVSVKAPTLGDASPVLDEVVAEVRSRLGTAVYAEGDQSFEATVVGLLKVKGLTVGTAESCTAGMVASRMTNVDGSSEVFPGGFVTYSPEQKTAMLGVPSALLTDPERGAVSDGCARAMALGVRERLGVSFGLSVTGVAGPDPVVENGVSKPSGLAFIGLAGPGGVESNRFQFVGHRQMIRARATQSALYMLYKALI